MTKKVMVSGVYDMLHSGHVAFLQEAAGYGQLYVCIGNDENVFALKGRSNIQSQEERKFMIGALACVHECRINTGLGVMDFTAELEDIRPDYFIVNEDGHTADKEHLCNRYGIEYKVLKRIPHEHLPARSTTELRKDSTIPFRIDIAGGWLDQPFVSEKYPGTVITVCIEPTHAFNLRSGMASSTRNKAIEIWQNRLPGGDREQTAKILFACENSPGTKEVSGSQDALGIVMPALNRYFYDGAYWPEKIESCFDEDVLQWLEQRLYLAELGPRTDGYNVLDNTDITAEKAKALAIAAEGCWQALLEKNTNEFGKHFTASFSAQLSMFPNMNNVMVEEMIARYKATASGWKLSGAGGGGYLVLFSEKDIEGTIKISIRRRDH